ncbi:NUDIX domain-containing protein [Thermococcus paralvinellae]|uniref:ADP-ribose pyrophosphatase n=1 Tax=Thermococcus paralvinellae TaxID=582419 RepID=W0I5L8_9EURY|nr:NUDIX hydrolase [Thermococcus paralvinellae]AHF80012.1 ADP-ribose pyrophosphatase [Thermococcus paralvinellae]
MDRYVLLIKAPRGYNITAVKEDIKKLISEKYPELKAEIHRCIGLTVDLVIVYKNGVVLIKRRHEPFKDHWALPGGFVDYGERVEDAAIREAKEETGLDVELIKLIGVYSDPNRDPRGHTVTTAFLAKGYGDLKGGDDAKEAKVFSFDEIKSLKLAFDHAKIMEDALRILKEASL